ncbi:hypothetical protein APUTEX25_001866, partial [Auxenochlorella protothecoides]
VTGEEYVLEPGERGEKQQHSPWSAPRDRRKRNKHNPSPLTISEDFEYTSPPKRHNGTIVGPNSHGDVAQGGILKDGVAPACQAAHAPVLFPPPDGQSPAARALRMSQGLDDHIPALHTAGPLAQGLFHRSSPGPPDRKKYSPLQAGLDVASFRDIQTLQSSISGGGASARTPARTTTSSLDPGSTRSSDRASRGSSQRKTCFTCPSPFCLGLSPARDSDSDEEVSVRRPGAGADGFVLRTRADFQLATPRGAAVGADLVRESRRAALSSGGRPKEPAAEPSVRSSRDAQPLTSRFGLSRAALEAPHPPARSSTFHAPAAACWPERGLTPNSEGGGSEGPCPGMGAASETPLSVDHLNDMLRQAGDRRVDLCSLGPSNPRDAEAMVRDACTGGGLVPNAATLRTLDKIWAVHEQLHGQY